MLLKFGKMCWFETVIIISLSLQMPFAEGGLDICRAEWKQQVGKQSNGGQLVQASRLDECQEYCANNASCLAVDFNAVADYHCWMYTDPKLLEELYDDDNVIQYRLVRNCSTQEVKVSDCPDKWIFIKNKSTAMKSDESFNSTLSTCFTYCRFSPKCQGVIFDDRAWLSCRVFYSDALKDSSNLNDNSTSNVYLFNKDCTGKTKTYGRCTNQSFPLSSNWCLPTETLTVKNVFFKFHPFCCPNSTDTQYSPIDSNNLTSVYVEFFDPGYYKTVLDCLKVPGCGLVAASYKSQIGVASDVCPVHDTAYFVSIDFSCTDNSLNGSSTLDTILPSMLPTTTVTQQSSTLLPTSTIQQQQQSSSVSLLPSPSTTTNPSESTTLPGMVTDVISIISHVIVPGTPSPTSYDFTTTQKLDPQTTLMSETLPPLTMPPLTMPSPTIPPLSLSTLAPLSVSPYLPANTTIVPSESPSISQSKPPISSGIPFSRTASSSSTSRSNQDGTINEDRNRTALILGAIGTAFGAVCLLFFILLLLLVVRIYLSHKHENVDIVEKVSTISWKKFLQGSSSV